MQEWPSNPDFERELLLRRNPVLSSVSGHVLDAISATARLHLSGVLSGEFPVLLGDHELYFDDDERSLLLRCERPRKISRHLMSNELLDYGDNPFMDIRTARKLRHKSGRRGPQGKRSMHPRFEHTSTSLSCAPFVVLGKSRFREGFDHPTLFEWCIKEDQMLIEDERWLNSFGQGLKLQS